MEIEYICPAAEQLSIAIRNEGGGRIFAGQKISS
jgi:hypothetical protein